MKYLKQLALILVIYLVGEALTLLTGLPVPGNIIGMILLLILLLTGVIKEEQIQAVCDFFLANLAFFFVVPGVNLLRSFTLLSGYLWQSILMILLTTIITFIVSGLSAKFLLKIKGDPEDE